LSKVLVTGGAGFIGSNLVNRLVQNSKDVVIFDNEFRGSFNNISDKKVQLVKGDITKPEDWECLPKGITSIFHMGAINGTKFFYEIPERVLEVNVKGVINMLEYAIKNNVGEVLFASSSEVYGIPSRFPTGETEILKIPDPLNPRYSYSGSKIIGELFCINYGRKYGLKNTIVRYHNVYGPKMGNEHVIPQLIRKLVRKEEFVLEGDGTETRSFCYIDDAVEATLIAGRDKSVKDRIFNIGNPEEVSISSLAQQLIQISGVKVVPKYRPKEMAGTKRRVPDITKIRSLGYTPKVFLKEGLRITYDWYAKHYSS